MIPLITIPTCARSSDEVDHRAATRALAVPFLPPRAPKPLGVTFRLKLLAETAAKGGESATM